LRRAIEHLLEDPLAEDLLKGAFAGKDTITVRVNEVDGDKKLVFDASGNAPAPELVAAAGEGKG
jgi:ATP-dependent Clp protease ATP-binding subunit ClpC